MAISQDIERGDSYRIDDIRESLLQQQQKIPHYEDQEDGAEGGTDGGDKGSISMVLLSTAVAVCGSFEFGTCVGFSSPAQSGITEDLHLSLSEYSMFASVMTIGAMFGAVTSGHIADFIGRKGAMRISAFFCIVGWVAICFAMGPLSLDFGRLCGGYGIGILSYVVPVFIAEIAPKNLRGGLTTTNMLLICTGLSVTYVIGTFIHWRILTLVGLIPCVLLLLGLFFIPESPRWLAKVGREKEFEISLRRLRGKDADVSQEAAEIQDYIDTLQSLPKARMRDLFQMKYARSLIVGIGLMVFQQVVGINGVGFYASETFVFAGVTFGKVGTIATGCIQVPATALGAILMDKCGRRPLLFISASGACLGCLLVGISFFLKAHHLFPASTPTLALSGILLFVGSFSFGMGPVPWVMMSEIFPLHVKAAAGSLVTLVNWFGCWGVSFTYNFLMNWSSSGTFFLYSAMSAITILFVAKVVPETKGRTLEEIHASMNSKS